jgi:hypothetical protein
MFVFQSYNYDTRETDTITTKNVIESCGAVLNYNNNIKNYDEQYIYFVKFLDISGKVLVKVSEDGLSYALSGECNDIEENEIEIIKVESEKFWDMNHEDVKVIEFDNPIHSGDAIKDETDNDSLITPNNSDNDEEDDEEQETNLYYGN